MANYNITVNSTSGSKGTAGTITMVFPGGSTGAGSSPTNRLTINPGDTVSFVPGTLSTDTGMSPLKFAETTVLTPSISIGLTGITPSTDTIVSGGSTRVGTVNVFAGNFQVTLRNPNTVLAASDTAYFTISGDSDPTITGSGGQNISAGTSLHTSFTKTYTVGGLGSSNKARIYAAGNAEFKLNSGSFKSTGYFDVVNNDVLTIRAISPSGYNSTFKVGFYVVNPVTAAATSFPVLISTGNAPSGGYGLETFNSSGNKTLSISSRSARYVSQGTGSVNVNNSAGSLPADLSDTDTISVTGMANNDTWLVLLDTSFNQFVQDSAWEVVRGSGSFTVRFAGKVNAGQNVTLSYKYYVLRGG